MTNPKWEEQIIVVPNEKLFAEVERFEGVVSDKETCDKITKAISENFEVMRRGGIEDLTPREENAEVNRDFKQPIPYVVIRKGNELFCTERLEGGGESRLHNLWSLGVGGHMNKDSESFQENLHSNMKREIFEEVDIYIPEGDKIINTIGYLNNEQDEVSQVHIGILMEMVLPEDSTVTVKETEQLRGFWTTIDELKEHHLDRLEGWSGIVVENMSQ